MDGSRRASVLSSTITLSNTILGTGMLAVPYAFRTVGALVAVAMLLLGAAAAAFGLYLLVRCSDQLSAKDSGSSSSSATVVGVPSYYACAKKTYKPLAFAINAVVFVKCFGVAVSYLVVIGDVLPDVLLYAVGSETYALHRELLGSRRLMVLLCALVVVPLSFFKQLHSLRFASLLSLCTTAYVVVLVVSTAATRALPVEPLDLVHMGPGLLSASGIFVFAFTCHQNIFSIYNELADPSPNRIGAVIGLSVGLALFVYSVVGLLGYAAFGERVQGNILANLRADSLAVAVGRLLLAVHMALSFPLQANPARACLDHIVVALYKGATSVTAGPQTWLRYVAETLAILIGAFTVAMRVSDLQAVFHFVGSTGSVLMCYILPAAFFVRLDEHDFSWQRAAAYLLAATGALIGTSTAIVALRR